MLYQDLKEKIILLEHSPGAVIREKELMKRYGVSRTPVREALMKLEMNGFVRIIPNIGTFVEDISFRQLKEVFEVRSYLIRLSGYLAAERISEQELEEIQNHIADMKAAGSKKELIQLDRKIHGIINRAGKNKILVKIIDELHEQAVRIWTYSSSIKDYKSNLVQEFEDIANALAQRDGEVTANLLEKHAKHFVESISNQLDF